MNVVKLLLVLSCAAGAVFSLVVTSSAFNEGDVKKLMTTKQCPSCDLAGANLSGADLRGAFLEDANLTGANLTGANLTNAILYFADLRGAVITGTKFGGARLTNAIWPDGHLCIHKSHGTCRREE